MKGDTLDPKALIREAYRMDLELEECRSVFLDWALSLPDGADARAAIATLLERHEGEGPHPMSQVLREGLEKAAKTGRRGGRRGRLG